MREQSELETTWTLITDRDGVLRASALLAEGFGPVGVDAERASGFSYGSEAYLVQFFRRGSGTFLFDPVSIDDFSPLAEALAETEWVLHAASQDIPCLSDLGLRPPRLFDTELAARLLGCERVGLGALVESELHIKLEKAHSAANWSIRPLPESWLEYAALDVALLPDLRDAVQQKLQSQHKTVFAVQEFEAVRVKPVKVSDPEPWRHLSGGHKLVTSRQRAIARELWRERDQLGRERGVFVGRLIPDSSIVAAAMAHPRSADELRQLRSFTGRESKREVRRWWKAVVRGRLSDDLPGTRKRDPDSLPHHRSWPERYPEAAARLAAARTVVEAEATRLGMPTENLLAPGVLRRISWSPPSDTGVEGVVEALKGFGARDWQARIVGPTISPVL